MASLNFFVRRRRMFPALIVFVLMAASLHAQGMNQSVSTPSPYAPAQQVSGTIRIWGHGIRRPMFVGGFMVRGVLDDLVQSWEEGFRKRQPGIRFDTQLLGDASAIGGLYTGAADIAILGRDILPTEVDGYSQVFGYKPFEVPIMTGSLLTPDPAPALAIFVHKENPLAKLTLAQLDAIFGADHRRGSKNFRTWGDLGLEGEWAGKPIHLYGFRIANDASQFFERIVLAGSEKWNGELQEFDEAQRSSGDFAHAGQQILDALMKDRYGIAISSVAYKNPLTKPLALALQEGGPFYEATRESVMQRTYPLARGVSVFVNRAPGQPIDAKVRELLNYILSREGQDAIVRDGGFLPLTPELLQEERRKIE